MSSGNPPSTTPTSVPVGPEGGDGGGVAVQEGPHSQEIQQQEQPEQTFYHNPISTTEKWFGIPPNMRNIADADRKDAALAEDSQAQAETINQPELNARFSTARKIFGEYAASARQREQRTVNGEILSTRYLRSEDMHRIDQLQAADPSAPTAEDTTKAETAALQTVAETAIAVNWLSPVTEFKPVEDADSLYQAAVTVTHGAQYVGQVQGARPQLVESAMRGFIAKKMGLTPEQVTPAQIDIVKENIARAAQFMKDQDLNQRIKAGKEKGPQVRTQQARPLERTPEQRQALQQSQAERTRQETQTTATNSPTSETPVDTPPTQDAPQTPPTPAVTETSQTQFVKLDTSQPGARDVGDIPLTEQQVREEYAEILKQQLAKEIAARESIATQLQQEQEARRALEQRVVQLEQQTSSTLSTQTPEAQASSAAQPSQSPETAANQQPSTPQELINMVNERVLNRIKRTKNVQNVDALARQEWSKIVDSSDPNQPLMPEDQMPEALKQVLAERKAAQTQQAPQSPENTAAQPQPQPNSPEAQQQPTNPNTPPTPDTKANQPTTPEVKNNLELTGKDIVGFVDALPNNFFVQNGMIQMSDRDGLDRVDREAKIIKDAIKARFQNVESLTPAQITEFLSSLGLNSESAKSLKERAIQEQAKLNQENEEWHKSKRDDDQARKRKAEIKDRLLELPDEIQTYENLEKAFAEGAIQKLFEPSANKVIDPKVKAELLNIFKAKSQDEMYDNLAKAAGAIYEMDDEKRKKLQAAIEKKKPLLLIIAELLASAVLAEIKHGMDEAKL